MVVQCGCHSGTLRSMSETHTVSKNAVNVTGSGESEAVMHETSAADKAAVSITVPAERPLETGGPTGPEPTRYGDWERKGRCIDF